MSVAWAVLKRGLAALTLSEASATLRDGTLRARDYADALLAQVAATDAAIGAWAHLDADAVRSEAIASSAWLRARAAPLHGIPVGVKDIIHRGAADAHGLDRVRRTSTPPPMPRAFSGCVAPAATCSARR